MKIFVGNIDYRIKDEDLRNLFAEYGEVISANIIIDRMSGRSKGFGFVEMPNDEEAKRAMQELNNGEWSGKKIVVNEARPKAPGEGRSNNFGKKPNYDNKKRYF
jgi:RNA recognition motif-containing protein